MTNIVAILSPTYFNFIVYFTKDGDLVGNSRFSQTGSVFHRNGDRFHGRFRLITHLTQTVPTHTIFAGTESRTRILKFEHDRYKKMSADLDSDCIVALCGCLN